MTAITYNLGLDEIHLDQPRSARKISFKPVFITPKTGAMSSSSRELPMPNVTRITSLTQAHATLLHCCNKLARFAQSCRSPDTLTTPDGSTIDERRQFQLWLEKWEVAFTEFLSATMGSMSSEELSQCRVLKANHLACNVVASDVAPGPPEFDAFESEFQAILDLASAVLQLRQGTSSPQRAISLLEVSPFTSGLDVRDPLYIILAHCHKQYLRDRANGLLQRFYR